MMKKRLLAGFLTLAMLVSLFPIPALAAEEERPEWTVTAFDPLDEGAAFQTIPQGGGEPLLPDTLTAWAYRIEDDTTVIVPPEQTAPEGEQTPVDSPEEQPDPGEADPAPVDDGGDVLTAALVENAPAPAEQQEPDIQQIAIPGVTWTAEPEYDHNAPGVYRYTPVLPAAYIVDEGVELPAVTVTVEAAREQTPVERVQTLIDALPDPEGIILNTAEDVAAQIGAIDEASEALSGEELAALDFARYEAVMLALAALMDDNPTLLTTASNIKYLDCDADGKNWTTNTCSSATVVESDTTTWSDGWYVVNSNVTVGSRITVGGTVHLILADGCKLTAESGGIDVSEGNSLTIYAQSTGDGMGELSAKGEEYQAGIGGGRRGSGGSITINGGSVTANGGKEGAGIGGGWRSSGGTITISGGTVTAIGNSDGAGIGDGYLGSGGSFSTDTNGGALISASSISDQSEKGSWGGVIFEGDSGQVYGNQTLQQDFEISNSKTLTIPENTTLTVPAGTTLTNNGTLKIDGTLTVNGTFTNNSATLVKVTLDANGGSVTPTSAYATFSATSGLGLPDTSRDGYTFVGWYTAASGGTKIEGGDTITVTVGQTLYAHWTENKSQVAVTFSQNDPAYGDTITITVTIAAANTNGLRTAAQNTVTFSMGGATLDTANVSGNTATLSVTLIGDKWKPGDKTITAEFGGSSAYTGSTGTGTLTVQKATPQVTAPTAKPSLTYTGKAQELISAGSTTSGCTMQYSLSQDSGYSTDIPTGTDAKTYTVYYKVVGDDCYNDVAAQSVSVTINPKSITGATVTLGASLTYTGSQQTQTVNSVTIDGLTAAYTVSNNTGTDAGDYSLTVTGSGNFTGDQQAQFTIAKASNSITDLTCANIVFGETPSPSATATFGTVTYAYSQQESGTYEAWNTSNAKGTWYVKASVEDADNYNGAEQIISFQVTAQREATPNAGIDFRSETLIGLTAGASYSITPTGGTAVTVTASENGTIDIQEGWYGKTLSIIKVARNGDYSDSEAQSLSIPARPNRPTAPLKLTKTADSITITNSYSGCEFSVDGTSWNDTGAFSSLTAGTAYSVQVRVKATDSSFKSASMTQAITTVAGDGSTTVKPGESVEVGTPPKTTVTNDGEKVTITTGGTTTTVTPAKEVEVGGDGSVNVPGGSTIKPGNGGPDITVGPGNGGTIGGNGEITIPGGGTAQVGTSPSTTITVPEGGGTIKPKPDGTVDVPGGSIVQTGENGPEITVGPGNGGNVGGDGTITVPDGGTVQIGKDPATTITPPTGGEVTPNPDGTVTVPDGTTVKPGDGGPEVTVGPGNGGTVGDNGGVTVGGGETVKVGDTTVTLPEGGGTVKPNPDGTIPLPGGTVVAPTGKDPITVPDGGGTVNPGTGEVTLNVHTVTFDSQGGSAVNPATATYGGKVVKPGNPTKSGYTFGGWYKESACTNAWNFDTDTVTGDMTLYAKWMKNNNSGGGNYTPPTYPPTVERPSEGGSTATVSPSRPVRGDTVTVTPKPDAGYEVDKITVTDQNGRPVEVTVGPDGTYTFTQPTGKVKIEVTYKPTQPVKTPWSNPFTDVAEGDWYYEAVRFVHERGLMNGYSDGRFGPNDSLSRAQLAQILFNKEGRPVVNYLLQYGDVSTGTWYTEAVRWATSQGIVGGYGNGMFGPNDPITREQLAVMLWRYSGSPAATNKELHFADADNISGYALEALRWAAENGILNGYGDGRLGPQGLATRAQVAQMLKNFLEDRENAD